MNKFLQEKQNLDTAFYARQIFPAVHIAEFRLAAKTSLTEETETVPSVAIVMPVFNTQLTFLKEAILSVLKN